jgi:cell division protein FtsL
MTTPQLLIIIAIAILVVNNFHLLRRLFVKKNS